MLLSLVFNSVSTWQQNSFASYYSELATLNNPKLILHNNSQNYLTPHNIIGSFILNLNNDSQYNISSHFSHLFPSSRLVSLFPHRVYSVSTSLNGLTWLLDYAGTDYIEQDTFLVHQTCPNEIPWGIDRIDRLGQIDCLFETGDLTGRDTHVYIIDTGINPPSAAIGSITIEAIF